MIKEANTFFSHYGHKRKKEIEEIFKNIDKIDINKFSKIVEPFCGCFGFSYYCYKELKYKNKYVLNDNDTILIQLLKEFKEGKLQEYIDFFNEFNSKGQEYIREQRPYILKNYLNLGLKYMYLKRIIYQGRFYKMYKTNRDIKQYNKLLELLKESELLNEDYKDIFNKYKDDKDIIIYLDPPYLQSYNIDYCKYNKKTDGNNQIIDGTIIYIDILELLKNSKCLIFGHLNSNAINKYIFKDYIINIYIHRYQYNKSSEEILIISNYKKYFKII